MNRFSRTFVACFLLYGYSMDAAAALDMNCRKTQFGQTPTLECVFTWSSTDDLIFGQWSMTSFATGPSAWSDMLSEGGETADVPGNERGHHISGWTDSGPYYMYSTGSLFIWAPPGDPLFHPDSPAVDQVSANLP
jgi:hypothetical protein